MYNPEELFRRLKPVIPNKINNLWIAYNASNPSQQQDIILQLQTYHSKLLKSQYYENNLIFLPPPEEKPEGEYNLGKIFYGNQPYKDFNFHLTNKALLNHTIITGSTGTGKSNLVSLLVLQLLKTEINFLILDWKASYRNLLAFTDQLHVYTLGRDISPISFNMWIPPKGTPITEWILFLIDILGNAYYAGLGVRDILLQASKKAFQVKGFPYKNGEFRIPENPEYPTNYNILEEVYEIKTGQRSSEWKQSTIRVLQSLTFGAMSRVCNDNKAPSINTLFNKKAILEMDSLSEADKTFIAEFLMLYRYRHLLRKEGKREQLSHLFIIDEAHEILKQPFAKDNKESIVDVIWRNIRELGEGIIACIQNPSLISVTALTNSFTVISFSLKSNQDIKQISGSLLLEFNQQHYIGLLNTGQAIVKTQDIFKKPFLLTVSALQIPKGSITDHDLRTYMTNRMCSNESESVVTNEILHRKRSTQADSEESASHTQVLFSEKGNTEKEAETLLDIIEYPFSSVVSRYKRLGLSSYKGNEIIMSLIEKNLIKKINVIKNRTRLLLFDFTEKGLMNLSKYGIKTKISFREGKIEHRYYCNYIAQLLEKKGFAVLRECQIKNNGYIDIVFYNSKNKKIAIEFETGKSDYCENIRKALKSDFISVMAIALNQDVKRKILNCKITSPKLKIITVKEFHKVLKLI